VPVSGNSPVRLWLVGFGTVGQWLTRALHRQAPEFDGRYGLRFQVVGIANRRDGLVYRDGGIDLQSALDCAAEDRSLRELAGVRHWETALEGLRATEADVLAEVSASPAADCEPGRSHLEEALRRGIPAVTSNKWPVALHGVELAALGRRHSAPLRAESTVMSGTPVLSTLREGLAGTAPLALRGLLNATANYILSQMSRGSTYGEALAEAQRAGLAERDPSDDVDGHDAVAKLMILSARVLGTSSAWPRSRAAGSRPSPSRQSATRDLAGTGCARSRRSSRVQTGGSPDGSSLSSWTPVIASPGSTAPTMPSSVVSVRSARSP
jgi:homoserine dehydrogenase